MNVTSSLLLSKCHTPPPQTDEMTEFAMARYRTQIWVRLREQRLAEEMWCGYHRHCPGIMPGDRVCIRTSDGTWTKNIIDHIGTCLLCVLCASYRSYTCSFTCISRLTSDVLILRNTVTQYTSPLGPDKSMKIRKSGLFTTTYEPVNEQEVIRDEPPHPTHIAIGTRILAKLSYMSNKFSPCVITSINGNRGTQDN